MLKTAYYNLFVGNGGRTFADRRRPVSPTPGPAARAGGGSVRAAAH
jgi:hypothetical protein